MTLEGKHTDIGEVFEMPGGGSEQWEDIVEVLDKLAENDDFIEIIANSKFGEALRAKFHGDLDPGTIAVIDNLIEEIHTNPFAPQSRRMNTKYEAALLMFMSKGKKGVDIEELRTLFKETSNPSTETSKQIARLNKKLGKISDHRIIRPARYFIEKISE